MTDPDHTSVRPVPGEMRPWSDLDGPIGPFGGAAALRLLEDVLPRGGRWLIAGPHADAVLTLAQERSESLTVLIRAASDGETTSTRFPTGLDIAIGALDGLSPEDGAFDVVLAADGLDRVLTPDSADLAWPERLDLLRSLANDGATIVVGLGNEFALATLLDARVARDRHGDEEWRPIHSDTERPCSLGQFVDALAERGLTPSSTWTTFGPQAQPGLIASADAAGSARPDRFLANAATAAVRATRSPLLALPDEALSTAARAGALPTVADGFLAIIGGDAASTAHAPTEAYGSTGDESAWTARREGNGADATWLLSDATGAEQRVPGGRTVESELRELAEREDVPGFRAYAQRLGEWTRTLPDHVGPLTLDSLVRDGNTFVDTHVGGPAHEESARDMAVAAAWFRFQDRLLAQHRRHPWPPWVVGSELVGIWSSMAGVATDADSLESARVLADSLAGPTPDIVDARTALADRDEAAKQLFEANGHIFGLERTIGFRDKQLLTREKRIRKLHKDLQKVEKIRNHPAYRTLRKAAKVREPRKFAAAVKKKAGTRLRGR
ncbi:hypothetical protein [Knoellia subterranea]|uniref:Uncharacterized protein n=1 Tax=Knoellia subterranea KCTC 19937 TaxID=1385521 RepID=A0A0A0JHK9_9MICO|nr:hypothetical protein [Knoellia subterranea]KGN36920.1 hypothetical protein N803_16020 [Knoellia subterranea KCTC 19937]